MLKKYKCENCGKEVDGKNIDLETGVCVKCLLDEDEDDYEWEDEDG